MKPKLMLISLLLLSLFLALGPTAQASSTWYVDGVNGSNSNGCNSPTSACKTIEHGISLAASGDSIMVAAATYTENLTISFSLKVIGSGANTTIIDGGLVSTVVTISSANAHVTLSKVTVRNGRVFSGGGGINNGGMLTISDSTLSNNFAAVPRSPYASYGGGIYNSGTLTISNSTLSGNRVYAQSGFALGGGIYNLGKLLISNSTISGNNSWGAGGGIYNVSKLAINNSTISGNSARGGDGVVNSGSAELQNSIVATSHSGGSCSGSMTSKGYNISSDNTCNFNNAGDLNNIDPMLGPLQNYGGPTQTQALLPGSPAIDTGNPGGCTDGQGHLLKTDQRGAPRPDKKDTRGCDRGAYESQTD